MNKGFSQNKKNHRGNIRMKILVLLAGFTLGTAAYAQDLDVGIQAYKDGDYEAALSAFFPLAEQGNTRAQFNLGVMHYSGRGVPRDYEKAFNWYRKAAEQGYARAQFNLGDMYYDGRGVLKNYKEGAKWYWKAAEQGYVDAQANLGDMYYNGRGVPQDYVLAYAWFSIASAAGGNYTKILNEIEMLIPPFQVDEAQLLAARLQPGTALDE